MDKNSIQNLMKNTMKSTVLVILCLMCVLLFPAKSLAAGQQAAVMPEGAGLEVAAMPEGAGLETAAMSEGAGLEVAVMPEGAGLEVAAMPEGAGLEVAVMSEGAGLEVAAMPEGAGLQAAVMPAGIRLEAEKEQKTSGKLGKAGNITWRYEAETKTLTVGNGTDELCGDDGESPFQTIFDTFEIETMIFEDCKLTGSAQSLFGLLYSLKNMDLSGLDTGEVTDMSLMFYDCNGLVGLDLQNFSTEQAVNMNSMFMGCGGLETLDLRNFNTENVTDMGFMFFECGSLESLNLSSFQTGSVEDMSDMFLGCGSLTELDITNFDTGSVKDMSAMFYGCDRLSGLDLSHFQTEKLESLYYMFYGCSGLKRLNLSSFKTERVKDMGFLFCGCDGLEELDLSHFYLKSSTDVSGMFQGCVSLAYLKAPAEMGSQEVKLPNIFYDEKGTAYQALSVANRGKTLTLTKPVKPVVYQIVYELNGGKNDTQNPMTGSSDKEIILKDALPEGCYEFAGWYAESAFETRVAGIPEGTEKDVILYAKWDAIPHVYDNGEITKAATCAEQGEKTYLCTVCGEKKTEPLEKTSEHIYDNGEITKAATCAEQGERTYTCTVCGEKKTEALEKTAEHIYDNGKITKAATCAEQGERTYMCTVCGEKKTEPVAKSETHFFDEGKVTEKPTCTKKGTKTYTCTVCGVTEQKSLSKTEHTYKEVVTRATLSKDGKVVLVCKVCKNEKKSTVISYPKNISLSCADYVYNGKTRKPTVTVKDAANRKIPAASYKVEYSGGKAVGKHKVKVVFQGNYKGTKTLYFTIRPAAVQLKSVTPGSKKLTVKWGKNTKQVTGYEITYSLDKNFKAAAGTLRIKKNTTVSKAITGLQAKKKYYVRIRTYTEVSGKKYYSDWSKSISAVTKK